MSTKLGVCCSLEKMEKVRAAGFDYWEVNISKLQAATEEEFEAVKSKVAELHFPAEAGCVFFPGTVKLYETGLSDLEAYGENALKRLSALGGKIAVFGSGGCRKIPDGLPREEAEKALTEVIRTLGRVAGKYGITIAIEPLNEGETNFINTVEEGLEFCRKVNHPNVKCLADFYHIHKSGETLDAVESAGDLLAHVHLALEDIRRYPTVADLELCKKYKKALDACGYTGRISLEGKALGDFEESLCGALPALNLFRGKGREPEGKIKITEYNVLGTLPDPFLMEDGTRISRPDQWEARRREMYKHVVELQYGTQPPAPEFLTVEKICKGRESATYRITTGKKDRPVSFFMRTFCPEGEGPFPAVIDGDFGFDYSLDSAWRKAFTDESIMLVMFNRTELANDIQHEGRRRGPLYDAYPEYSFGALGAWAWGYSRCIDALEILGIADPKHIVFTGHSRGGKTAALAGVLDERASIVNPNETNAGACSCYRIHMKAIREDGLEKRSEPLADLHKNFDFWLGEGMGEYTRREQDLPFDCHMLKAMIAPRTLFVSEAVSDIWTNPIGSWMTTVAADEVFKFLGVPENNLWYFRDGYHYHELEDVQMLVNVIKHKAEGRPLNDRFFRLPFPVPPRIFDWKCPETK